MVVSVNRYDTDVTIRYKCCDEFKLPVKLISVIPGDEKLFETDLLIQDFTYRDTMAYTRYLLFEKGLEFDEIYAIINKNNPNIDVDNLIFIIVSFYENDGQELPENAFETFNQCYTIVTGELVYQRFSNNNDLGNNYISWKEELIREFKTDINKLNEIRESEIVMEKIDNQSIELLTTDLKITAVNTIFNPTFDGEVLKYGLLIFDKIRVDGFLTTCIFIDKDGKSYSKIYDSGKVINNNLLFHKSELVTRNCFYFKFNIGDENVILKDKIYRAYYIVEDNIFYINYPVDQDYPKMIAARIEGCDMNSGMETKVSGTFEIYNIELSEIVFTDCITNNSIVNNYLFLDENQKLLGKKKRLDFHFKSINDDHDSEESIKKAVSVTMKQFTTTDRRTIRLNGRTLLVEPGVKYAQFTITQGISRTAINHFIRIFDLLVKVMIIENDKILQLYQEMTGQVDNYQSYSEQDKDEETCNNDLLSIAPDLFVEGYNKRCPCDSQPRIILSKKEFDYWKEQGRDILSFPNENAKYWFVCPYEEKKYPGVKVNYDLPNKDKYPYLVCCWDTPHMEGNQRYSSYRNNIIPIRKIGAKADKKILTKKILVEDRNAYIPITLENIIKNYCEGEVLRYGVPLSPSSILHSVLLALKDPIYESMNKAGREVYIQKIRKFISMSIYPNLLSQEMYDFTDAEIIQKIEDPNEYFDPRIMYRAIEEAFKINLYTFNNDDKGTMVTPRFKHFYSRAYRNRPCVLVIKSVTKKIVDYEHWELIADFKTETKAIGLFGDNMNKVCYNMFMATVNNITLIDDDKFKNLYTFNILETVPFTPVSQFVDSKGKLRGVTFKYDGNEFTVSCGPSQPENLPLSLQVKSLKVDDALEIFGRPRSYSPESSVFWYDLYELPDQIAIYVKGVYDSDVTINKLTLREFYKKSYVNNDKYKEAMIFIDIIRWLFTFKGSMPYIDFVEKCFINIVFEIEYDLKEVKSLLPKVGTLDEALDSLKYLPIFEDGKIMVSERTWNKLYRYFISLSKRNLTRKKIINKYFDIQDFIQYPNVRIMIGDAELYNWLRNNKYEYDYTKYFTISNIIHPSYYSNTEGYVYQDKFNRIWFIQNLEDPSKENAIRVSKNWIDNRINIAYSLPSVSEPMNIEPKIYGINGLNEIILMQDSEENVPILHYGNNGDVNAYAGMLQL